MSNGRTVFQLGYQISPIILTGGIASLIPGNMLPIVAITQAASFTLGLLQGNVDLNLDDYFAQFEPLAGGTLVNNQIGQYPFANQTVAANAIIAQPLSVSLRMICPVRMAGGYITKLATFGAIEQALALHNASGGTYTVATPAKIYTNCILTGLRDATGGETKQKQIEWQWDFQQPLVALDTAQNLANSLMSKLTGQLPIDGEPSWSGLAPSVGTTIGSAVQGVIPASSNVLGSLTQSDSFTSFNGGF